VPETVDSSLQFYIFITLDHPPMFGCLFVVTRPTKTKLSKKFYQLNEKKNTTLLAEQFQNLIKNCKNRYKVKTLTHIYDISLSWLGTGTSIKGVGVN